MTSASKSSYPLGGAEEAAELGRLWTPSRLRASALARTRPGNANLDNPVRQNRLRASRAHADVLMILALVRPMI
jgi:hypothetical protein